MKILIVDDEPDILETTGQLLELSGHEVELHQDWRTALERAASGEFDVALQDARMPDMDLPRYLPKLKEALGGRLVLFSANHALDIKEAAQTVDGFLAKPFRVEDLLAAVDPTGSDNR